MQLYYKARFFYYKIKNVLLFILKCILPYQLVWALKQPKTSDTVPLVLIRWPEGIPEVDLREGIPQELDDRFCRPFLSGQGKIHSFIFGEHALFGLTLKPQMEHDLSYILGQGKVTVPVCLPGGKVSDLNWQVDNKLIEQHRLKCGQWHYHSIPEHCQSLKISSQQGKIILGEPLFHKTPTKENRPKCVVMVVVDALSMYMFDNYKETPLMPHTLEFFEKGRVFTNAHSTGDWTPPCLGGIFTGLYTTGHGFYQRIPRFHLQKKNFPIKLKDSTPIISEYFKNAGYLTCGISSCWRTHPLLNFGRGFDRYLYMPSHHRDRDVIHEAIEHLKAFPQRDHFMYLHLMQVHSIKPPAWSFSSEVDCEIMDRDILNEPGMARKYSPSRVKRNSILAQEVDNNLKQLYDFLNQTYSQDELVVCLSADHGCVYLDEDEYLLSDTLTKIPLFVQAPNLEPGMDHSIVQPIDLLPNLLHLCHIEEPDCPIDGLRWPALGGTEREFALTESIYEGDYKLKLRDNRHIYDLESSIEQHQVHLEAAKIKFWEISTGLYRHQQLSQDNKDFSRFDEFAMEHIASLANKL